MLQTGRVQQGPSFCVRSPRGSGAWSSANNTVHLIHQSVQHPHGNGRAAGRPESCLNNGARRRPSSWLKRESHCTGCRLSTGAYSINHYDQSLGWVGQTSTRTTHTLARRRASKRVRFSRIWKSYMPLPYGSDGGQRSHNARAPHTPHTNRTVEHTLNHSRYTRVRFEVITPWDVF